MDEPAAGRPDEGGDDAETRAERWVRIERLFRATFDQSADVQASLLSAAAGEGDVVDEVRALLAAHAGAGESFLASLDLERAAAFLADSDPSPHAGQLIGPYIVERELGRGGMAVIYLVRDPRLGREVALKVLSPALAGDPGARRRLLAEARSASRLDHPNIAAVLDIGETRDGQMWIAMPRYRGTTLRERIAQDRLPLSDALSIARQIVAGLAAAHEHGVIHRDIKPANVMITEDGTAKILDFGIARSAGETITRAGATIGTVAYMSPEQTRGGGADAPADVWAVGVVLYEMLSGRRPFRGDSDSAVIHAIRNDAPSPLHDADSQPPGQVVRIVERCLLKDPARRYATMRELSAALAAAEQGAARGPFALPAARPRRRHVGVLAGVALVAALALVWRMPALRTPPPDAAAANLAVLPLAPAVRDTSLSRLGVELAITLARALDGAGSVRVLDPLAIVAGLGGNAPRALDDAVRFARGRGATSLIHGTIVRAGTGVRIDAALDNVDGSRIAQASVTGDADDITMLTDAVAVELLRQMWRRGRAPVPSLAAITTHSMPALRAYLDGERAIAESRFYDAPEAFERAIAADSTFWSAYWRLWYVRSWHGLPVDSAVRAAVRDNLAALPAADGSLAASRLLDDQLQRHDMMRETTRAFPNYWPAWFDYADWLVHTGPYLGFPLGDARSALEQVVSLNPDLVPAWEHLFWVAIRTRDTALTGRALGELERLRVDSLRAPELRYDVMLYYTYLADLVQSGGEPDSALTEEGGALLAGMRSRTPQENLSASLHMYGFHRAQLALLDRTLAYGPPPDIRAAHEYGRALSWAARGAWDSALVSAQHYMRDAGPSEIGLLPAQLAAVGALVGAVEPAAALSHLRTVAARVPTLDVSPPIRAEIAWLEGLSAFTGGDRAAIGRARADLRRMVEPSGALALERSLAALDLAMAGRTKEAGDSLAALEWEIARRARQFEFARTQPFLNAVNRLLAARWLIAGGNLEQADALLIFTDATFPSDQRRLADANLTLAPLALLERAHIAEARGQTNEARGFYAEALARLDLPVPPLRRLLPETR